MQRNQKFLFVYPLPVLLTPLPLMLLLLKKSLVALLKQLKVLTRLQEFASLLFFGFFSCFTVSVTPSINASEFSIDFIILIISFIFLFEINKVNLFPALTAPFPLVFLSNLSIAFKTKLLTNPGKVSLAKGISKFVCAFFPELHNQEPKDPPDWIVVNIDFY